MWFALHGGRAALPLSRAALDGAKVDDAPLDVHVGSVALRRFIEVRQPLVTLHGHVHESPRLMRSWHARIGRTHCLSAAHDGEELALVRFDPHAPEAASRALLEPATVPGTGLATSVRSGANFGRFPGGEG